MKSIKNVKLHLGCGDIIKEGYLGLDLRKAKGVDIIANAFRLDSRFFEIEEIYTRHMLEHLPVAGVRGALRNWHSVLKGSGKLHIIVPNIEFHFQQYLNAEWKDLDAITGGISTPESHSMHSLYGWQRDSKKGFGRKVKLRTVWALIKSIIVNDNYSPIELYWDAHKSGFTEKSLTLFLKEAGFTNIETYLEDGKVEGEKWHLHAIAIK